MLVLPSSRTVFKQPNFGLIRIDVRNNTAIIIFEPIFVGRLKAGDTDWLSCNNVNEQKTVNTLQTCEGKINFVYLMYYSHS